MGTKKNTAKDVRHQGELLRKLADWYGETDENFAKTVEISPKTFYTWISFERIEEKNRVKICRALHIPLNYFEDKYELPLQRPTAASEGQASYGKSPQEYIDQISKLHEELHAAWKKIAELQEQVFQGKTPA